jgi:hypothetical protein
MNVGDIFHVHTVLTKPKPKPKIVMFVGNYNNNDLFIWFNTQARKGRPAQVLVAAKSQPGITRNCYLDCSQAKTHSASELQKAGSAGRASNSFLSTVAQEVELKATTLPAVSPCPFRIFKPERIDGEAHPRLARRARVLPSAEWLFGPPRHVSPNGGLTHLDTELEQLAVDPRRSPEPI